jgi:hypothetical protein
MLPPFGLLALKKIRAPTVMRSFTCEDRRIGGTWVSFLIGRILTAEVLSIKWKNFFNKGREWVEDVAAWDVFAKEEH